MTRQYRHRVIGQPDLQQEPPPLLTRHSHHGAHDEQGDEPGGQAAAREGVGEAHPRGALAAVLRGADTGAGRWMATSQGRGEEVLGPRDQQAGCTACSLQVQRPLRCWPRWNRSTVSSRLAPAAQLLYILLFSCHSCCKAGRPPHQSVARVAGAAVAALGVDADLVAAINVQRALIDVGAGVPVALPACGGPRGPGGKGFGTAAQGRAARRPTPAGWGTGNREAPA